jgi:hypothetical protein
MPGVQSWRRDAVADETVERMQDDSAVAEIADPPDAVDEMRFRSPAARQLPRLLETGDADGQRFLPARATTAQQLQVIRVTWRDRPDRPVRLELWLDLVVRPTCSQRCSDATLTVDRDDLRRTAALIVRFVTDGAVRTDGHQTAIR